MVSTEVLLRNYTLLLSHARITRGEPQRALSAEDSGHDGVLAAWSMTENAKEIRPYNITYTGPAPVWLCGQTTQRYTCVRTQCEVIYYDKQKFR